MSKDGGSSKEVARLVLPEATTWKKVEGILWDRQVRVSSHHIS